MQKEVIETIVLQEAEIKRLTEELVKFMRGYHDLWKENEKLRKKLEKLEIKHGLSGVNV